MNETESVLSATLRHSLDYLENLDRASVAATADVTTLRRQLPRAYAAQADSRNKRLISDGSAPSPSGKFVFHSAETGSTVVACPPAVGWETVNGRTERTALVWERSL